MKMLASNEDSIGKQASMLLLGPIVGLIYVIFLPFVSIVAIIGLAGGKVIGKLWGLLRNLVYFGWRPAESYLSGKKKKGGK
jgi:hypothetical protein